MNRRPRLLKDNKAQNFWGTLKRLLSYLGSYWVLIGFAALFAVTASIIQTIVPILVGSALSSVSEFYQGRPDIINIFPEYLGLQLNMGLFDILLWIVLLTLGSSLLNFTQGFMLIGITQRLTFQMRTDLADKINTLPLKFFDKYKYGDVLSRMTNDVDTINQTLTSSIIDMFRSFSIVISIITFMIILRWEMAAVAIVTVIVSLIVASRFIKISQKYFVRQAAYNGNMNGHVEENYNGHLVVKAYNHQKQSKAEFDDINEKIYDTSWKSQFISGIMVPIQFFFANIGYISIALIGGFLVMNGQMLPGLILTFVQFMRLVSHPIQNIGQSATVLQMTAASAERIFFILDADSEEDESHKELRLEKVKGAVEFKDVYFRYVEDTPVIKGFNAKIEPGQTVAIVGPTGAGKTTMVNLLMRFYEIDSGSITIDGVDIRDMKRDEVRSQFGMVLQDSWIFEGTVHENISYGSTNKTMDDIEKAARNAQTHHFIHSLPNSYDFLLNEDGLNISQGQRQLITISRVMLADKPMLILDEATSSVDTRTEILIQKAMDRLMTGRTSFVIAHRLSTIKNADVIFVMRDGNIVEQGNHDQLLEQDGFYAELYNSQFEEEID